MAPLHLAAGSGALRALSMLLEAGPATGLGLGLGLGLGVGLGLLTLPLTRRARS